MIRIRSTAATVLVLACLSFPGTVVEAQGDGPVLLTPATERHHLVLPEGELERTWKYHIRYPESFVGFNPDLPEDPQPVVHEAIGLAFTVDASAPFELRASIEGERCPLNALSLRHEGIFRHRFRRLFTTNLPDFPRRNRHFIVEPWATPSDKGLHIIERMYREGVECELTITLTRNIGCSMYAQVSGDVGGAFFGDVAFFNIADAENPVANLIDPGTAQLLDGLMDMGVDNVNRGYARDLSPAESETEVVCDDNGDNCEDVQTPPPASFSEAIAAWAAESEGEGGEMPAGYGDHFGLSLTDVKFGDRPAMTDSDALEHNRRGGRVLSFDQILGGGGTSLFSLGLSSPGLGAEAPMTAGPLPISALWVLPGAFDERPGGAKFLFEGGGPGEATVKLEQADEHRVAGTINARLRSERPYENGYAWINVSATFVALRGQLACQGQ